MKIKVMIVTPELASEMMKWNTGNRRIDPFTVSRYAEEMRNGRWQLTGEPIAFDINGKLVNGQHRLQACIVAGVPIHTAVATEVSLDAFPCYDDGKQRSHGDIATLAGHKYGSLVASTARLFILADSGMLERVLAASRYTTKQTILAKIKECPEIEESAAEAKRRRGQFPHVPESHYCFALSYFPRYDTVAASEFVRKVAEGIDLAIDDPEMRFRTTMIQESAKTRGMMQPAHRLALFIKAWRFSALGQKIKKLSYTADKESFPSPDPTV